MMKEKYITLRNGETTIVDEDDYEKFSKVTWGFSQSAKNGTGYATRWTRKDGLFSAIRLHREILGLPRKREGVDVDHVNGNKLDNRKSNLRACTRGENIHNRYRTNLSGLRGVGFRKDSNKWMSRITKNGKTTYLGLYDTKEEASEVFEKASKKLYTLALNNK